MITFSAINQSPEQEPTIQLVIPNNIDFYLSNTKQKIFNTNGSIDFTLNSALLEHYKREDKSTLIDPDVKVHRDNTWQIQAQQGDFFHLKEIITFNKKVLLEKQSPTAPFQVSTNSLLLNIQQDLVISDSNVTVTANSWNIKAKSMTLNLNSETHQFNQVTARYRYDKNS